MSRPGGPYRDERYPPQQRQYPQDGYQQGYPQQGYPDQGYEPDYGQGYGQNHGQGYQRGSTQDQGYGAGQGYDPGYAPDERYGTDQGYDRGYGDQQPYRPQHSGAERPRPSAPPPEPEHEGGGFRLPGLGLLLSLLGLVVQVLCLVVLPWVSGPAGTAGLPELWDAAKDVSAGGFGGSYVLLFSYPLAALGILLSLVSVLESVVVKVIWAILALIGVAALALRFGWDSISAGSFDFSQQEITYGIIALSVLFVVIFMLKMAMSTFRIVGGLVLLAVAGVHIAALRDMTTSLSELEIAAYGPAVGYVLAALAAFIGPRRIG
ncbi:hypothetical protein [Actinophytocola sp.]|uniref:hypothetical protein n=1 Tax=Actinophytocola sp. TaxID=1872138 RepID=UPI002ECFCF7A